jgi:hypothetical protein
VLHDRGVDGRGSMFRMAYPCNVLAGNHFDLKLKYNVTEGHVSRVMLDVFDDADEWLYSFDASEDFTLRADSMDIYGNANLKNDPISLVGIALFLDDGASATVKIQDLTIGGVPVSFYARDSESVGYQVFIERDLEPTLYYQFSLCGTVAFGAVTLYYLSRRSKAYIEVDG